MKPHSNENTPCIKHEAISAKQANIKWQMTIEPAAVLTIIYMAGIIPWTQQYVYHRLKTDQNFLLVETHTLCHKRQELNDSNYLTERELQRKTSLKLASYHAASLIPLLCSAIILGSLSDFMGRKIVLLIPLLGAFARVGVTAIIVFYEMSLNYLYLAVVLESLLGGPIVSLGIVYAYISDITTERERAFRIIVIELCIAIGVVVSMFGIGCLIMFKGFFIPMIALTACCFMNIFYIYFGIQESRPRRHDQENKFWSLDILRKIFFLCKKDIGTEKRWRLFVATFLFLLVAVGDLGKADVTVLYLLAFPFCFTPVKIALFATVSFLTAGIGAVVITKLLQKRLGEMTFYIIGSISSLTCCLLLGLARSTAFVFVACLTNVFGRLQTGMMRSYLSKLVKDDEQGILFSSLAWFDEAAIVMGSMAFNVIYAGSLSLHTGFVFFLITGLFFVSIVIGTIVAVIENKYGRLSQQTT